MKKISVVLAVYNEEDHLRSCLESVQDLAWEIVVVDGGSTDNTLQIARDFGARIIRADNPAVFHINKNKAIDAGLGDWILQLDADEVVTEELKKEIRAVTGQKSNFNGYWIPRKNFFMGRFLKKGGQYPDYTLRLYKRGKGKLPAKDVHEQAKVDGRVGYLKNDLLHLRDKTFGDYLEGFNKYTDLQALQLKDLKLKKNFLAMCDYLIFKPFFWFLKAYFRHLGLLDGFPGFIFALFSALRFPVSYIKYRIDWAR